MTEDELELFIAEQKARIAKERQQLELNKSLDKSHDMRRDILGVSGSNEIIQTARSNKDAAQSNKQDDGRALPRGSYTNLREKLNAERREEYKRFLEEKKMRSGPENGRNQKQSPNENATNSLGIGERNSAKLNARRQRNQEYNEYLKQKGQKNNGQSVSDEQKIRNMNGVDRQSPKVQKDHSPRDINGYSENTSGSPRPRHAEHYYDTSRPKRSHHYDNKESRTPLPRYDDHSPPRRYYDDVPPPPRRGWGTPVHLDYDDILRRKRQEEARYRRYDDDMDYYRERGIQPSISDPYLNRPGPSRRRYYDRYEDERDNDDRRVRFEEYSGRGRYSKGDDPYDDIDNKNLREERSRTMPEMDRPVQNNQPEPVNTRKPRPKSAEDEGFFIGHRQSQSASQRKKEEYRKELEKQMEEAKETKRREREEGLKVNATGLQDPEKLPDRLKGLSKHGNSRQAPPHGYNTTTQNTKYQPSFAPQMNQPYVPPPAQDLGLEAAFLKSKAPMLEKPFELERYQYKSDSVDPYSYYGHRNPMEGEPGVSPYGRGQDNPPQNGNSLNQGYNSTLNPRPTQPIQKNGRSSIQGFVGDDSKTPQKKGGSRSYQDELLLQIQEKERRKREEKAAQERYDQKMEAEAKLYEPFGKGGGGAPMRDNKGHIIADLKQVKQMQTTEDVFGGSTIQGNPMISPRGQVQIPVHHTLPESFTVGGDTTPVNAQDEYKESLRLQIEEKKRRQAEEKERERLREEKQERDLQEQRDKMQREFEAEKEKQRLKEEKTRQQNEEMAKLAEEKRKQAEMKQAVMEEKSVKQHSRITEIHKETEVLRVESPPIPTLRKTEPRVESPPIPTLRKAEPSRTESPPVPALRKQEQTKIPSPRNNSPIVPTLEQMQGDNMPPVEVEEIPVKQDISDVELPEFLSDDEDTHAPNGRRSPPVPAVTTKERAGDKERNVMSALSTMRKQLQSEQRRVQQALEREYDPYTHVPSSHGSRRASPQVNVLDLDKKKKPKPVTVRRELTNHAAAQEFNNLKDRGSQSRQKMREQYPDKPTTDIALEAQQRALLRQQEEKLDNMRKAYRPSAYDTTINLHNIGRRNESPLIALESSSAFIGLDSGESKIPPDERSLPGSARTRDLYGDIGSINEDVLEVMERKNKERIAALAAIESDMSNEDPDDVLQKFMSKGSSDRPPTGKSEDLSLWLQPSGY
ncbi:centrosome and spindle pole-associated protein 1-like isoform X2 [Antedon mediterranea]|uniref:centrosome and spindle pole-associated protein 1-like isoform X2 n=1 Tax=Antedon mediterranea TaxID=105859 RepID=UPI003AF5D463